VDFRALLSGRRSQAAAVGTDSPKSPLLPSAPFYKTLDLSAPGAARSPVVTAWQTFRGWFSHSAIAAFASLRRVRATQPITLDEAHERLLAGRSLAHHAVQGQIEASRATLEALCVLSLAGVDLGGLTLKGPLRTVEEITRLAQLQPAQRGLRLGGLRVEMALSTADTVLRQHLLALREAGADLSGVRLSGPLLLSPTGKLPAWISSLKEARADVSGVKLGGSLSRRYLAPTLEAGAGMDLSEVTCNGALTSPDEESLALIGRALTARVRMNELIVAGFPDGSEHAALRDALAAAGVELK
jgi:hypothetical protein